METLTYGLFEVGCLFQCDVYVIMLSILLLALSNLYFFFLQLLFNSDSF